MPTPSILTYKNSPANNLRDNGRLRRELAVIVRLKDFRLNQKHFIKIVNPGYS